MNELSREDRLARAYAHADELFASGYTWAATVLQVLQELYGIEGDDLWLGATGLGGGMGRSQDVCGALTGAVVGLGLAVGRGNGRTRETRQQARDEIYSRTRELYRRFQTEFGDVRCLPMIEVDLSAPGGQEKFKQSGARDRVCVRAIHVAIEAVADLV
jgi:C_GCAxxG_C_C family probable redox protein